MRIVPTIPCCCAIGGVSGCAACSVDGNAYGRAHDSGCTASSRGSGNGGRLPPGSREFDEAYGDRVEGARRSVRREVDAVDGRRSANDYGQCRLCRGLYVARLKRAGPGSVAAVRRNGARRGFRHGRRSTTAFGSPASGVALSRSRRALRSHIGRESRAAPRATGHEQRESRGDRSSRRTHSCRLPTPPAVRKARTPCGAPNVRSAALPRRCRLPYTPPYDARAQPAPCFPSSYGGRAASRPVEVGVRKQIVDVQRLRQRVRLHRARSDVLRGEGL